MTQNSFSGMALAAPTLIGGATEFARRSPLPFVLGFGDCPASPAEFSTPRLETHRRTSPLRGEIEAFIASEFAKHFGARVTQFMPTLIGLHDRSGRVCAAVGCRSAAAETLFLEHYTKEPIDRMLADKLGTCVPREQIVEIGSLACRNGRAAMTIVTQLAPFLVAAGFTWVAFTGADTVLNVFRRLKLQPHELCDADPAALGEQRRDWGTYYEHNPKVMAGRLLDGIDALESMPRVQ